MKNLKSKKEVNDSFGKRKEKLEEKTVRKTLMPELELIKDSDLREKVVKAWALACQMGGYVRLEDVPMERFDCMPDVPNIRHQKETAQIAFALVNVLKKLGFRLNEDYVVAGALCHDVGKPIEWKNNQSGILSRITGAEVFYGENPNMPSIEENVSYQIARHPVWGLYVAMVAGMPEHVVHIIASHSFEGDFLLRSPEAWLVRQADHIWWHYIGRQIMGGYPGPIPQWREGLPLYYRRQLDSEKGPKKRAQLIGDDNGFGKKCLGDR